MSKSELKRLVIERREQFPILETKVDKCKCTMAISMLGEGCRYCQPQNYIDILHDSLADLREEVIEIEADRDALRAELAALKKSARNVYEIWAGSDGIPIPETAVEAYLLRLIEQMRDEAVKGMI